MLDATRDVTAKLVDVAPPSADWPNGYELNITDTVLRLRYREGWDREVMMEPGTPYQITIGTTAADVEEPKPSHATHVLVRHRHATHFA